MWNIIKIFGKTLLVFSLLIVLFIVSCGEKHELPPPRPVDFTMKDVSTAETSFEKLENNKFQMRIKHDIIRGVTPEMIVWWFQNFTAMKIELKGKEYPAYQIWHPVDHVYTKVLSTPNKDIPGFSKGAYVEILEKVGPLFNPVRATVKKLDETGVILQLQKGLVNPGLLEHTFTRVENGTLYQSKLTIGVDTPILKYVLNPFIKNFLVSEEAGKAWLKHNIEEVGNFEFFLLNLYNERAIKK
jgi:hypothetical protein